MIMNNKIIIFVLAILALNSCADPELGPVLTFDIATKGAYIRFVDATIVEFDKDDPNGFLEYEVDFVDEEDGTTVVEYGLDVTFIDNTPDNGDDSESNLTFYQSWQSSEFSTSVNGNPGLQVNIPLGELLSLFGLSEVAATDQFRFFGYVIDNKGNRYSSTNSTPTVRGSAFQGYFDFPGTVTCPISDDLFTGTYLMDYTEFGDSPAWATFNTGEVTIGLRSPSRTVRVIPIVAYQAFGGFDFNLEVDFICDRVVASGFDTGLSCAAPNINFTNVFGGEQVMEPADITDDSQFSITLYEDGGGCGYGPSIRTIQFTKQ